MMNALLPAALAAELDALAGAEQLQRVAELLRHMADSLDPSDRLVLLDAANRMQADADSIFADEQAEAEQQAYYMEMAS